MVNVRSPFRLCGFLARPTSHRRFADDRGSAGMSTFVVVMTFIMLLGLGVAGMRTFIGASDLQAAGQAGARAAALEHDLDAARAAAQRVVDDELARSGLACENLVINVGGGPGGFEPGGSVVVDLECTVSYADVFVPGLGGSRQITASATEPRDCLLGGGSDVLDDNCYYGG